MDDEIAASLCGADTIAIVGASHKPQRPVYQVMAYLLAAGFDIVPINPGLAGQDLMGQRVFARLSEVPRPIDLVDIFRRREALGGIVDEALALSPQPRTIWMQIGLRDDAAAARARAAGVATIMDRCTKIDHYRLCH
ncbi:MAG: CoA-binding protein [Alphaproteobacteria bacterium]